MADDAFGGGMVALVPSRGDALRLVVGPDGETADDLHLTVTYLGPNAEAITEEQRVALFEAVQASAAATGPVTARVFGHATFNPDGHDGREPCAVYLVGETDALGPLRATFSPFASTDQLEPFIAHVTGGYGLSAADLSYTGPVLFDALRLTIGSTSVDLPLTGTASEEKSVTVNDEVQPEENAGSARDPFTAGVLLGITGLAEAQALEWKAGPPGATVPSADPGASKLREYWVHGQGAAKIRWGVHGDFNRCVKHMRKHVGTRAEGLCFAGETEFLTREGVTTFADAVDSDVLVLTSNFSPEGGHRRNGRWVQASVRSFGEHPVLAVTLRRNKIRKVIRATRNHRWFASSDGQSRARQTVTEITTDQLRPGMTLAALTPHNTLRDLAPSPFGVAAGAVFGDGNREVGRGARIDLWGEKDAALLSYFAGCAQHPIKNVNGTLGVRVSGIPGSWKQRPRLDEGTAYLLGWLAGYIAADGTVNQAGSVLLDCHDRETVEFTRLLALRLGIVTFAVQVIPRTVALPQDSPLNGATQLMYRIAFDRSGFPAQALILPEHRRRFNATPAARSRMRWTVESVDDRGEAEEVFCVVVPGTHTFALADHIWVANCNIYHRSALGVAPGREGKAAEGGGAELWVPDTDEPGGWRAHPVGWAVTVEELDGLELKALTAFAPIAAATPGRDDEEDPTAALDRYAGMAEQEQLTTEQAYEDAIAADVAWNLEPDGELTPDAEEDGDGQAGAREMLFDSLGDLRRAGRP